MKKILISVTYIKEIGGISTSVMNLLNEIHDKYDVTLCIPTNYIASRYSLPASVKLISGSEYLKDIVCSRDQLKGQSLFRKAFRNLRRIYNRFVLKDKGIEGALLKISIPGEYDVAIAFADFAYNVQNKLCYDYFLVLNQVKARKKIAWIHNNPEKLGWSPVLIEERLKDFDFIVNVSEDCKRILDEISPAVIDRSKVVLNTYNLSEIKSKAEELPQHFYRNNGRIHFVTVSRVEIKQKRHDRIIDVCKRLINEGYSSFDWTVVGDGSALGLLKERIDEEGLENYVSFIGQRDNPYPYIKQADAFILCSDYEGFGMTIKEAQILECPTFITGFGAAKEVVDNLVNGEICENSTEGLYKMIKSILDNPDKLESYRKYLKENPINNKLGLKQFDGIINW